MRGVLWTDDEVDTMRKMLRDGGTVPQIAEKLGRTVCAVDHKMSKLGLYTTVSGWLDADTLELKRLWLCGYAVDEMAVRIGKTEEEIRRRLQGLSLVEMDEERRKLAIEYGRMGRTARETADAVGASPSWVCKVWREEGLGRRDWWTNDKREYLRTHFNGSNYAEIGEVVGKSCSAVYQFVARQGYTRRGRGNRWTDEEIKRAVELLHDGRGYAEIAELLGRTPDAVYMRLRRCGVI